MADGGARECGRGATARERTKWRRGNGVELTGIAQGGSASSGARRSGRIRRRRSSAAGEGENVGGGVPGLFWSRETTRRTREDLRSSGRRRGGERGMVAAANGVGGDGCVRVRAREREQRREGMQRGRKRSEGTRGLVVALLGRPGGKQEVAGARGRARRARAHPPGREEDDRGGSGDGLGRLGRAGGAGPGKWAEVSAR